MDKTQPFKLLDAYFDAGGNFIDVSNLSRAEICCQLAHHPIYRLPTTIMSSFFQIQTPHWILPTDPQQRAIRAVDRRVDGEEGQPRPGCHSPQARQRLQEPRGWQGQDAHACGNHRRSLHISVRESLKKLKTELDRHPLPALVGPHDVHRGGHGRPAHPGRAWQGPLPRHLRHSGLGR
ncbi:hypothetical protein MPH_12445 [Macrophomina phaseolina MS6]|uniref:Uncharacterized protein n=1 Tax=Macrophomina phaseolina (strain MS6) TaxID=1126212 RepID=K2RCI0_MACPH|nr:hypothetical protein MPH_12445 [Macrophomina phaseolina MS6]